MTKKPFKAIIYGLVCCLVAALLSAPALAVSAALQDEQVVSVTVTGLPLKTVYGLGESEKLELEGLQVAAELSGGGSVGVPAEECTISGYDWCIAGQQAVTVTYEGKSDSFQVTVEDRHPNQNIEFSYGSVNSFEGAAFSVRFIMNELDPNLSYNIFGGFDRFGNTAEKMSFNLSGLDGFSDDYSDGWYTLGEMKQMKDRSGHVFVSSVTCFITTLVFYSGSKDFSIANVSEIKVGAGFYWVYYAGNGATYEPSDYKLIPNAVLRNDLLIANTGSQWLRVLKKGNANFR